MVLSFELICSQEQCRGLGRLVMIVDQVNMLYIYIHIGFKQIKCHDFWSMYMYTVL